MVSTKSLIGILTGTTAAGKTGLSIALARKAGLEIINADSLLVYRRMDIGTAKPTLEERQGVPHHLIDICDPDQAFNAGDFVQEVHRAIGGIEARGKRALIVGGTGFYLKALLYGLWTAPKTDPEIRVELEKISNEELYQELFALDEPAALRIGKNDRYRLIRSLEIIRLGGETPSQLEAKNSKEPNPRFALWIVDRENGELFARIAERTAEMITRGLVDEVKALTQNHPRSRALDAVGYSQVRDFLSGTKPAGRKVKPGLPGLAEEIELATRQLVKRQRTWFRGQAQAKWFILDKERELLEKEFHSIYG